MAIESIFVKCAVCGWEGYISNETIDEHFPFELAAQDDNITLAHLVVQECPMCKYVSQDISKLEFKNIRDIMRTQLYRKTVNYSASEPEDPKGYLERTLFSRYLAYALVCELNKSNWKAASALWKATKLLSEGAYAYLFDENNLKQENDMYMIAYKHIIKKMEGYQQKTIDLLQKEWLENKHNFEVFGALLVATAFAFEDKVNPLLEEAHYLLEQPSTPDYMKQFLINRITIINESLNYLAPEEEYS